MWQFKLVMSQSDERVRARVETYNLLLLLACVNNFSVKIFSN